MLFVEYGRQLVRNRTSTVVGFLTTTVVVPTSEVMSLYDTVVEAVFSFSAVYGRATVVYGSLAS